MGVRADVFMPDQQLQMRSDRATDGGKVWKTQLEGNPMSFEGVYKANQALRLSVRVGCSTMWCTRRRAASWTARPCAPTSSCPAERACGPLFVGCARGELRGGQLFCDGHARVLQERDAGLEY